MGNALNLRVKSGPVIPGNGGEGALGARREGEGEGGWVILTESCQHCPHRHPGARLGPEAQRHHHGPLVSTGALNGGQEDRQVAG